MSAIIIRRILAVLALAAIEPVLLAIDICCYAYDGNGDHEAFRAFSVLFWGFINLTLWHGGNREAIKW